MPEINIKEVRLPELHLPEIKRDEIVRSLSGLHLPQVDLGAARKTRIKVPALAITSSDIGKLVAASAAIARLVRPAPKRGRWFASAFGRRTGSPVARLVRPVRPQARRWRLPLVVGALVVAALGAWALLRRPAVRTRLDEMARRARERFDELRARPGLLDMPADELVALDADATETAALEAADVPTLEESGTPA